MNTDQRDNRKTQISHALGLKFQQGYFFVRIIGREYVEAKPFVLRNENGNRAELAAGEVGVDNDQIQDQNGNTLLRPNEDEKNLIFHQMYGVSPSRAQVFEIFGRNRNNNLQDFDAPGEIAAYTAGYDSPYNNPTRESEMFTVAEQTRPKLQAYNPTSEAITARASFHVEKLRYSVIEDEDTQKAMLQGNIPSRIAAVGGGVQDNGQVRAPEWLTDLFGDSVRTASEILTTEGSSNGTGAANGSVEDSPDLGGRFS